MKFLVETYADMFQRKAVIAYTSDGEYYGDVTINFPKYSLDDGECFLSADCQNLINEMVKTDTWKLQDRLKSIMVLIRSANLHRNLLTNLKRRKKDEISI